MNRSRRSVSSAFKIASFSHKGLVRESNQDSVGFREYPSRKYPSLLAVLADGIGGHLGGEVASAMAVDAILAHFKDRVKGSTPQDCLQKAFTAANQSIFLRGLSEPRLEGMGTTAVCAFISGHVLHGAHLGDSRLYLFRRRMLYCLTSDHTWLAEIGGITPARSGGNMRGHPLAQVLSRYLGSPRPSVVDHNLLIPGKGGDTAHTLRLKNNDVLLLCSDGLTDLLADQAITQIILTCQDLNRCARALVYHALQNGGHDNCSVILIKIT